jgi:hypothetical protein
MIIALCAYPGLSAAVFSMRAIILASIILMTASRIEVWHCSWDDDEKGTKGNKK